MLTDVINMYASKAAFCRAIGMKEQFLTQIERGERKISPRYAFAIQQITNGAVTIHDLRPDVFGPTPRAAA